MKMSIGNGPDIPTYDKEREKEVKLGDEVNTWWESLDESEKLNVLESIYPDQVGLIDSDELWERTSRNDQLEAYKDNNGYGEEVQV